MATLGEMALSEAASNGSHLASKKAANAIPERGQWGNKVEFVLSCISLSVGLGNVWRFPYLAYANGGGAFLIPYFIILFVCGKPMYFMEVAFGQYHQEGAVTIWKKVSPIGRGIGMAQMVIQGMTAMYYVVIMAWTMYYFWATFISACHGTPVPWGKQFCDSEWAHKETCFAFEKPTGGGSSEVPLVSFTDGVDESKRFSSAQQYYDRVILMRYDKGSVHRRDLSDMGTVNWILLANLGGCWILIYLALMKGISSAGKVMYITSTVPFLVLFALLIRGATLDNAWNGIKYFLVPQFDLLLTETTWRKAADQMFYSLSIAFGSLVMLGSYNKRSNNCYQDAVLVSVIDTVTSITSGLAVFSILGYLAGELDVAVDAVAEEGPGLVFVTFPEAASQMQDVPHLWAIMFFLMLFTIGMGSEVATLETVMSIIYDKWPVLRGKKPFVCGIACIICFILGIPVVCQGGIDIFLIFDNYAGGFSVLFPALAELIIIAWVHGVSRFVNDTNNMLQKKLSIYWRSTWGALAPATLIAIIVMTFVSYTPLLDDLPAFADPLGWGLAMCSVLQIPIWAGVAIYQAKGATFREKLTEACWPAENMIPMPKDYMPPTDNEIHHLQHMAEQGELSKHAGINNPGFHLDEDL